METIQGIGEDSEGGEGVRGPGQRVKTQKGKTNKLRKQIEKECGEKQKRNLG